MLDTLRCDAPLQKGLYKPIAVLGNTLCLGKGDERKLGEHCRVLTSPPGTCLGETSKGATLLGWSTGVSHVCRKCACNAHNALCNRHGIKQPPLTGSFDVALEAFLRVMPQVRSEFVLNLVGGFDSWLARWSQAKQAEIIKSILTDPIAPNKVKSMVKIECYHDIPKRARLIQYYHNKATQAMYGLEFVAAQKAFTTVFRDLYLDGGIDVTIASGMNAAALSEWMNTRVLLGAVKFRERDGKNWDSTMRPEHSAFKRRLFSELDHDFTEFVEACEDVKGFGLFREGVFRYKVNGTVKSGHNDTSLRNGIINAAIAYIAFRKLGVRASILVAGDDLLVAVYSDYDDGEADRIERELGIVPVARKFSSPADVSFISGVWYKNGESWQFTPKIGRLVKRLWWTTHAPGKKSREAYIRGVARGLLPSCGGIPIIRQFLLKFDSGGRALMTDRYWEYRVNPVKWDPGITEHLADRYGLSQRAIVECDEYLSHLPPTPLIISHPVLDRIMEVDLADPADRAACDLW